MGLLRILAFSLVLFILLAYTVPNIYPWREPQVSRGGLFTPVPRIEPRPGWVVDIELSASSLKSFGSMLGFSYNEESFLDPDPISPILVEGGSNSFLTSILYILSRNASTIRPEPYAKALNIAGFLELRSCFGDALYELHPLPLPRDQENYSVATIRVRINGVCSEPHEYSYPPSLNVSVWEPVVGDIVYSQEVAGKAYIDSVELIETGSTSGGFCSSSGGFTSCYFYTIHYYRLLLSGRIGYQVNGTEYVEISSSSYSIVGGSEGDYRLEGGFFRGWGPLAAISVRIEDTTRCTDDGGENYSITICDYASSIGSTASETRGLVFVRQALDLPLGFTIYNGTNNTIAFTGSREYLFRGGNGYSERFNYNIISGWSYEEGWEEIRVASWDEIEVGGYLVRREWQAGRIIISWEPDSRDLPQWGSSRTVYISARAVPHLARIPGWVFTDPQRIKMIYDVNASQEYIAYTTYRWINKVLSGFIESTIAREHIIYRDFELAFLAAQIPLSMSLEKNATYPSYYEALIRKRGSSELVGIQSYLVLSFSLYYNYSSGYIVWTAPWGSGYPAELSEKRGIVGVALIPNASIPPEIWKGLPKAFIGDMVGIFLENTFQRSVFSKFWLDMPDRYSLLLENGEGFPSPGQILRVCTGYPLKVSYIYTLHTCHFSQVEGLDPGVSYNLSKG
jgi:hypothetical protein